MLPFNLDARAFLRAAAAGSLDVAAAARVVPPPKPLSKKRGGGGGAAAQQPQQQQQQQPAAAQQQPPAAQHAAASAAPGSEGGDGAAAASGGGGGGSDPFHHVIMNLPAAAVEFLDALRGSFCPRLWAGRPLPLVHCHTFAKGEEELAGAPVCRSGLPACSRPALPCSAAHLRACLPCAGHGWCGLDPGSGLQATRPRACAAVSAAAHPHTRAHPPTHPDRLLTHHRRPAPAC